MLKDRLTNALFGLLVVGMLGGAMLMSSVAPQVSAAPRPVLTASAEPPTPTSSPSPALPSPTPEPSPTAPPGPALTATAGPVETPKPDRMADPAVSKETSSGDVTLGSEISFSITVTNEGNDVAQGVIVEDSLPGSLALISASIDKGQAVVNGNTAGFWIGDVAPGEVIRGEVTARVVSVPEDGEIVNEVVLRSSNATDRLVNNRSNARIRVLQPTPSPTIDPALAVGEPSPTPAPVAAQPTPAGPPPSGLPVTASSSTLPYGLLFLMAVGYMGVGLYLWLRPRRRK